MREKLSRDIFDLIVMHIHSISCTHMNMNIFDLNEMHIYVKIVYFPLLIFFLFFQRKYQFLVLSDYNLI